ncbi:MAG: hypothetical protein K2N02_00835 [Alistipes sp.]|nr:hypothetical protein [Alistipes sp.]
MFQMKSERLKGEYHSVKRLRLDQEFLSPHRKAPVPSLLHGAQHLSRHCEGRQARGNLNKTRRFPKHPFSCPLSKGTQRQSYVIASECNERGNLNKTEHLCFNHNCPVVVLVQIATASAMPHDDGGGYSFFSSFSSSR